MKTSTQAQILAYIKEEGTTTAKSIISYIGFSPQIVFRHLKKLIGVGLIKKTGLPPRVEYFVNSLEGRSALESKVYYKNMTPLHWAQNEKPTDPPSEFYCPATDVWQGRFDRIAPTLIRKKFEPELVSLVASAIGEIGDNCFTHNAPGWIDTRGAWFEFDLTDNNLHVIIADRGRGILKSLQAVRPSLQLHRDALFTALTELGVTGRAPELRGNPREARGRVGKSGPARPEPRARPRVGAMGRAGAPDGGSAPENDRGCR